MRMGGRGERMEKREKVIKGLECCILHDPDDKPKCERCPYDGACLNRLKHDALQLLRTQEPRVMTLDEVLELKFDDVVYLELYPTGAVLSAIVVDVIPKLPDLEIGVVQFRHAGGYNGINNADLSYYGKTWRCWTAKPAEEQREAEAWNKETT